MDLILILIFLCLCFSIFYILAKFDQYGKDVPIFLNIIFLTFLFLLFLRLDYNSKKDESIKRYCNYYSKTEICKKLNQDNIKYLTKEQKKKMLNEVEKIEKQIKNIEIN